MNILKLTRNKTKITALSVVLAFFSSALVISCAEEFTSPEIITGNTLVDVAATDTTLQILSASLTKTGIGISLDNINSGQHTVFAPSDSAFREYFFTRIGYPGDDSVVNYVNSLSSTSNPTLAAFTLQLQYHIVSSETMSDEIQSSQVFTTINAARLSLSKSGSNIFINGNTGTTGGKTRKLDIDGSNGVIHVINKFLTAISTSTTAGAASVITSTGFGLGLTVSYSTSPPTITNGVTGGNNYDLFALAIKKTGLATTVRPNIAAASLPDFTFFAPSDAAMITYLGAADEPAAVIAINALADASLTAFTDVIKYHIVTGRVLTTDLTLNQEVTTLLTGKTFKVTDVTTFIFEDELGGTANMSSPNILSNAGVLHRISAVMEPQ